MRLARFSFVILLSLAMSQALSGWAAACSTVDLDIAGDYNETTEDNPGAVAVRRYDGNDAPRKGIILQKPTGYGGNVTLTRSNTKVKVFTAAEGGTEITFNGTDNKFAPADLPKNLFVQGDIASGQMRDVTLTLTMDGPPGKFDSVTFTVLWCYVTPDHTGVVEDDNSARDFYSKLIVPQAPAVFTLGHHLIATYKNNFNPQQSLNSRGSEFIGSVVPANFVPQDFGGTMHLARERVSGWAYWGPNGNENSQDLGSGGDTSDNEYRDDDPQSGGSSGKIYDLDLPGSGALFMAAPNTIIRCRQNFKEWAEYDGVRCSEKKEWYTRQSYKRTGNSNSGTAESGTQNTLTDNNQNWTADEWAPGAIKINGGTGINQVRHVTANTATTITVTENWGPVPDSTSTYEVINTSTWTEVNDVSYDNESGNGTTKTTWNLE